MVWLNNMKFADPLLRPDDEFVRVVCRGFTLVAAIWLTSACGREPCSHSDSIPIEPQATPFSDGRSIFSVCAPCPALPKQDGVDASGSATVCDVTFRDRGAYAAVGCFYGPGGNTSSSIANDVVTDAPNLYDYCTEHCPDQDALHGCSFAADETGVQRFLCHFGAICD